MKVKVISQTKIILETESDMVTVPTISGIIGVLPKHENLISVLDIGELKVKIGQEIQSFAINGGLIKVTGDDISILVNEAVPTAEIVQQEIDKAIEQAEKQKVEIKDPTELIQLEKRLRFERFKKKVKGI
jgi:F-type H+-transporting ATPase subunit epsilon